MHNERILPMLTNLPITANQIALLTIGLMIVSMAIPHIGPIDLTLGTAPTLETIASKMN